MKLRDLVVPVDGVTPRDSVPLQGYPWALGNGGQFYKRQTKILCKLSHDQDEKILLICLPRFCESVNSLCIYNEGMAGLLQGKPRSKEHLADLSLMEGGRLALVVLPNWWPTQVVHQNSSFSTAFVSSNFSEKIKMPQRLNSANIWMKDGRGKIRDAEIH